jgi:hypothetical protein
VGLIWGTILLGLHQHRVAADKAAALDDCAWSPPHMSNARRVAGQDALQLPVPPSGGWSLLEAADALCPHEAQLYREGGPTLEAVLRVELCALGIWAKLNPPLYPDGWLSRRFIKALCQRPDLQLTGRDLAKDPQSERFRLAPDLLVAAGQQLDADGGHGVWLQCQFVPDQVRVGFDRPKTHRNIPDIVDLIGVRIETQVTSTLNVGSSSRSKTSSIRNGAAAKPEFSPALCRDWLIIRVRGWPQNLPPPSAMECLVAARAHFAGAIGRDRFFKIRGLAVPRA